MQLDQFLSRLEGVRPRGTGRWSALCPAHTDKTPSLSIKNGERGLLIKCFAGCNLTEICKAVNISRRDLFFDAHVDPVAKRQRDAERRNREHQREQDGFRIDAYREAEALIAAAHGIDISQWSHEQLNHALNVLADAYTTLETEARR